MDACEMCGKPIIWAVTLDGVAMPLDAEVAPPGEGRYVIEHWPSYTAAIPVTAFEAATTAKALYRSHAPRCIAESRRKGRRKA